MATGGNRALKAKALKERKRWMVARFGSAQRWGDPRPVSTVKRNVEVARDIVARRAVRRAARKAGV